MQRDMWKIMPPQLAQRILAIILNDSLAILTARYSKVCYGLLLLLTFSKSFMLKLCVFSFTYKLELLTLYTGWIISIYPPSLAKLGNP